MVGLYVHKQRRYHADGFLTTDETTLCLRDEELVELLEGRMFADALSGDVETPC